MDTLFDAHSHGRSEPSLVSVQAGGRRRLPHARQQSRRSVSIRAQGFACPQEGCHYSSLLLGNLKKHGRVHTGKKPFVCLHEGCGYASVRSGNLKQHWRTHSDAKPFVCSWQGCGQVFRTRQQLTKHRDSHRCKKSFDCLYEGCARSFRRSTELKRHQRAHRGYKPFVCTFEGCGYACAQLVNLTTHLRIHTGERPFVCPSERCGHAFRQAGHLKAHLRAHTRQKCLGVVRRGLAAKTAAPSRLLHGRKLTQKDSAPASRYADVDRPPLMTTGHQPPGEAEQHAPRLELSPVPLLHTAGGRALVSTTHVFIPDWLKWLADECFPRSWHPVSDTDASDLGLAPLALTNDDKAFWQALLSPANRQTSH